MTDTVKSAGTWADEEERANIEARCLFIDECIARWPDRDIDRWGPVLAVLLDAGVVSVNSFWWEKEWPEEMRKRTGIFVLCNDVFAWGCADSEDMLHEDLMEVYRHWRKDPSWGAEVWCMKRRNEMPQAPVAKIIRAAGVWDIDAMGLEENGYDQLLKKQQSTPKEGA